MIIKRDKFLAELIQRQGNGMIKVITGLRRCGKSFLLFKLFVDYLKENKVDESQIIKFSFDDDNYIDLLEKYFPDEPTRIYSNRTKGIFTVNSKKFRAYINELTGNDKKYYILLDEIQILDNFSGTLNGFLHHDNFDVYVTGSNSKMLSTDIPTEFRGRGDQINLYPLTFKEYFDAFGEDFRTTYNDYTYYGGMPHLFKLSSDKMKSDYLKNLFKEVYIKDIVDRNGVNNKDSLEKLIEILASSIGSYTTARKLENAFKSNLGISYSHNTIKNHINYFVDSFLLSEAKRYDVKGKSYISANSKYFFTDLGLRNALLNFRQQEQTHLMENLIYNELLTRGYNVDIGVVEINEKNKNNNSIRKQLEIDFVCNSGHKKYYIQSAYAIPDEEKLIQEKRPLINAGDSFKKIIIVNDDIRTWTTEEGILIMSIKTFLLNDDSLLL